MTDSEFTPVHRDTSSLAAIRHRTPARVFVERSGLAYRTETWLELPRDHAMARDAVEAEMDLERDFGDEFVSARRLFMAQTRAASKAEFLLNPGAGRQLSDEARRVIMDRCPAGCDFQLLIGDGLSAAAVAVQVPGLLPLLENLAEQRNWRLGQSICLRYCRVGILNDIGELLSPRVAVLLIGERPGMATADSLSAYMAFQPRTGHTDARRNLVSNIHARGVEPQIAAERIVRLAERMMAAGASGIELKEDLGQPLV